MNGPTVKITASCEGCAYMIWDYFGTGWQTKKRCSNPEVTEETVTPKTYDTPLWCPLLTRNLIRAIKDSGIIKKGD